MKTLITGGKGFIGKHLAKRIVADIYDIEDGNDIRDKFKLDKLFQKERYELVINLAARAGVPGGEEFYQEYFSTNCIGLKTLLDVSSKYGVKKLIHFSSSSALNPISVYGITKLAGEHLVNNSPLNTTVIRPFTVIGENGRKEMVINKWKEQILRGEKASFYGDGNTFRGYTYVDDLLDGTLKTINTPKSIYDIGGNQKVSLEELWQIFKEVFPKAEREILPLPSYDIQGSIADISKAKKELGWEPKTDIRLKIKELLLQ